jgi:hypothetical protein
MVGLLTNFLRFVSQSEIMPVFKSVRLRKEEQAPTKINKATAIVPYACTTRFRTSRMGFIQNFSPS